jgi:phenylacetate-CoA ligase
MLRPRGPWVHEHAAARGAEGLTRVRELRAAERFLRSDPAEVRALAERRLAEVMAAARTVEPYRTLWAGLRELRSLRDLAELPIVERRDLQGLPFEARLTRPRQDVEERQTSGTTGVPLTVARSPVEDRVVDVLLWRQLRAQGIPMHARRMTVDLEGRREPALLEVAGRHVSVSLPESAAAAADVIRAHRVEVLIGISTVLLDVADVLGPIAMQGLATFGSVRTDAERDALRDAFGVRPMDFYGATEVSAVSWECPTGPGYHVNADAVVLEVVGADGWAVPPGEPGDLVVTSLLNRTTPIVRYRLADVGTLLPGPCPCGIRLPLMGQVEGRSLGWITAPRGHRVSPQRLMLQTLLGREVTSMIRRYRVVQRARADFLVEIEWTTGRREELVERLAPAISWTVGSPVRVECRDVAEFPLRPSEKFRQVVSLVDRDGPR